MSNKISPEGDSVVPVTVEVRGANELTDGQDAVAYPLIKKGGIAEGLITWMEKKDKHLLQEVRQALPPKDVHGRDLVDPELWSELSENLRESIHSFVEMFGYEEGLLKPEVYSSSWAAVWSALQKSTLYRLFVPVEPLSEEKIQNGLNFMALILALMLTIPYAVLGSLDGETLMRIRDAKSESGKCGDDGMPFGVTSNSALTIYAGTCGLIIIILYYLLRPDSDYELRRWSFYRGRFVVMCASTCTTCAIIGAMVNAATLFRWYSVPLDELCSDETEENFQIILITGLCAIAIAVVLPISSFAWPMPEKEGSRILFCLGKH
jgi:hypothetical protein